VNPRQTLPGTGAKPPNNIDTTVRNPKAQAEAALAMGGSTAREMNVIKPEDLHEQPTRALTQETAPRPKYSAESDPNARTHINQQVTMPPPPATARDMPAVRIPGLLDQLGDGTGEVQKAKVWVATHKPPTDPDPRLILLAEPDSARAASFRVLRHRLAERSDPRTIAVSSPLPHEGKTTVAANLAMALGECGRARVLLVEANMRSPALAALFGFLPPECFSAQLQRHRDKPLDPWSVVEVYSPSLHVAAVKPGPENEGRPLLDAVAFGVAMEMLKRSGYDYIVVDTPPVLGSADVNLVEDFCDGVLLTTWSRKSSSRLLRRAVDQLAPAKILGITLLDA